jgi:hypothetical protein
MNGQTAAASWPPNDVAAIATHYIQWAIAFRKRFPIEYLIPFIPPLFTQNERYPYLLICSWSIALVLADMRTPAGVIVLNRGAAPATQRCTTPAQNT